MKKRFAHACDPISCETHAFGACLALLGTFFILLKGLSERAEWIVLTSGIIFGLSMFALYIASSIYHYCNCIDGLKVRLRKWDHAMIYVLIAGSYTPVCLSFMPQQIGLPFIKILWAVAAVGIVVKIFWINAPRTLSTLLYLGMGWSIMLVFKHLTGMTDGCLALIVAGGLAYSIGALAYIFKKPNFSAAFGFHELFHIFILIGSAFHFAAVYFYVL